MKRIILTLLALAVLLPVSTSAARLPKISIQWEEPQILGRGGYTRVHKMNDGRLMCSYTSGGEGWIQSSSDNGLSWTPREKVIPAFVATSENGSRKARVLISNPETAQLPDDHPYYPGRIFYAVNLRPDKGATGVYPYSIAFVTSDDGGKTWSPMQVCFSSDKWVPDVTKGCWEPFVLPLPDGRVQIYYSDETPYFRLGFRYQNISVLESSDGGETWTEPRVVCYTPACRDGMPALMIHDGKIYLSIEANPRGSRLHPQVLYTTLEDNWSEPVGPDSPFRFDPFVNSLETSEYTSGAPYLVETENFFVISYQTSIGADVKVPTQRVMEVQACRKSEMKKNVFRTMRGTSRPIDVDPVTGSVMWNSLYPLGGDEIMACCQYNGQVALVRGKISLN